MKNTPKSYSQSAKRKIRGQGMAEYIIIVALVAVAGIATWELVGSSIGQSAAGVAASLAGQTGQEQRDAAQGTAVEAVNAANEVQNLNTYGNANGAP